VISSPDNKLGTMYSLILLLWPLDGTALSRTRLSSHSSKRTHSKERQGEKGHDHRHGKNHLFWLATFDGVCFFGYPRVNVGEGGREGVREPESFIRNCSITGGLGRRP